jgi:hypothetical protein
VDPVPDPLLFFVVPGIEPGTPGSVAKNSELSFTKVLSRENFSGCHGRVQNNSAIGAVISRAHCKGVRSLCKVTSHGRNEAVTYRERQLN